MRIKILGLVTMILILLAANGPTLNYANTEAFIQENPELNEQKMKQKMTMKDMISIAVALSDYIKDHGVAPKQDGSYVENIEFCKALAPYYIRNIPVYDGWGNALRVYCGEACNGKYGISGCGLDDYVVVSYGKNRQKESWEYNSYDRNEGYFAIEEISDFDKDFVNWNGAWIRAPNIRNKYIKLNTQKRRRKMGFIL